MSVESCVVYDLCIHRCGRIRRARQLPPDPPLSMILSWKCRFFRCRPQLVLTTWCRVFLTRRPDTADVSATSCDVGFFFSVSYVVSLPNCRHVVVGTTTTYPFLSCSGWRHLSRSCFCHLLVGAKSIITRAGTVVSSFSLFSLKRWFETTATNPKQPFFLA